MKWGRAVYQRYFLAKNIDTPSAMSTTGQNFHNEDSDNQPKLCAKNAPPSAIRMRPPILFPLISCSRTEKGLLRRHAQGAIEPQRGSIHVGIFNDGLHQSRELIGLTQARWKGHLLSQRHLDFSGHAQQ